MNEKHRRSIRIPGYDYASAGAYFVTVCTQHRECLFGEIRDGAMCLNAAGETVREDIIRLDERFQNVTVDSCVIMPNHIHAIFIIDQSVGAQFIAPGMGDDGTAVEAQFIAPLDKTPVDEGDASCGNHEGAINQGAINRAPTLGWIVRTMKAATARRIRMQINPSFSWQRNYYEHVIRDENDLNVIREYIENNPLKWELDDEYKI